MTDAQVDNYDNSGIQGHANTETKLRKDGQPDKRFKEHGGGTHGQQGTGFEEMGDGSSRLVTDTSATVGEEGVYKPNLHKGQKQDGSADPRTSENHGFGGDKALASQAGQKGGSASYENGGLQS